MPTVVVFVCPGGNGTTIANTSGQLINDGRQVPHCPSGGTWQTVELGGNVSVGDQPLDHAQLAEAFGAGFVILGIGLVMAFAVRLIVRSVRDA